MKKLLAVLTAITLFASALTSAFALEYGEEYSGYTPAVQEKFSDVPSDYWAYDAINRVVAKNWFKGYPDKSFRPDASISRAEAMKVFVEFLGLQLKQVTTTSYHDVKATEWYAPYIEAGKKLFPEIAAFDGTVAFRPESPVTREDTIYALVIALKYNDKVEFADQSILNMYNDKNSISELIKPYAAVAVSYELVSGYEDGTIRGQDPLTRAEFATLLYRASNIGFGTGGGLAAVPDPTPAPSATPTPSASATPAPSATPTPSAAPAAELGKIECKVADASTGAAIEGATITLTKDGVSKTLITDSEGKFAAGLEAGTYSVKAEKQDYNTANTNVSVVASQTTYMETILMTEDSEGHISGTVHNAVVQNGVVEGAKINFRKGGNAKTGDVDASVVSDAQGKFSINLPAGNYTAECIKEGFVTNYVNVVSQSADTVQDITLTPVLDGVYSVVLTWGENPRDLDLHITGPRSNGERFHVAYYNMHETENGEEIAFLDRDDITSYGPETITLHKQIPGVYRFSIHDYTDRNTTGGTRMSESGAKVVLRKGETEIASFSIPTNRVGTVWTVFELNGDDVTPINELYEEANPSGVSSSGGSVYDLSLFANLPDKE